MTKIRNSPSGVEIEAGGGGGDVSSVFARTGDVVAEQGDYTTDLVSNTSNQPGATVSEALNQLDSSGVINASGVSGANVTEVLDILSAAIDGLDSSEVDNVSTVAGSTVTDALDALGTAVAAAAAGRLLGAASRLTAGAQTIACPAGTRRVLVYMSAGGGGGGGAPQTATPSTTNSGGGGGGSGAEQEFLYTSATDIASVDVSVGAGGSGAVPPGGAGDGGNTTVTINGDVFTSNKGEAGVNGSVTGAPNSTGGVGGRSGRFNFQSGSSYVLLRSSGGAPGTPAFVSVNASPIRFYGGTGGSNSNGGGGRGGDGANGEDAEGCGGGGGGGATATAFNRNGGAGDQGAVQLLFFTGP